MKLLIESPDTSNPEDYTKFLEEGASVRRLLNRPAEMKATLVATTSEFLVPPTGSRVQLVDNDGHNIFTGYLMVAPGYEYLGWGMRGPMYRYTLVAISDECLLDRKAIPSRAPLVGRSAGEALKAVTEGALPGAFDTSGIRDIGTLGYFEVDSRKTWSEHAAEIARRARAMYRVNDGKVILNAVGATEHQVDETIGNFNASDLKLYCVDQIVNDFMILGDIEPQAYCKDYFCGDGFSLRFDLSQIPFKRQNRILLDEEFKSNLLDPVQWAVSGSPNSVSVRAGRLAIECDGVDASTVVQFTGDIELGGALILQHGVVNFTAASSGVIGGLYSGPVSQANCLAGFQISPSGSECRIQPLINGASVGSGLSTTAGHQYALTTRLHGSEIYRRNELFHSSIRTAENAWGGEVIAADVRIVMELHDLDPGNPSSGAGPATVLYDGMIGQVPPSCSYALLNGGSLHSNVTFTRITRPIDAEVRSAQPGQAYRTRLPGSLSEGAECSISESPALQFFAASLPVANEKIVVKYRATGRSVARVNDAASIAGCRRGNDNGVFSNFCEIVSPEPRTSTDCTNAARALLDDSVRKGWAGEYRVWSDFLNGADVFPGEAVSVVAPTRGAEFSAIIREVHIGIRDLKHDRMEYKVRFADDRVEPLAIAAGGATVQMLPPSVPVGSTELPSSPAALTGAEVINVESTTVTVDVGITPNNGCGIEIRRSDAGWGQDNDRNLIGRFATSVITLPRLSRTQSYFLRQYDACTPPHYSKFSTAIYVDYPL